MSEEPTTPDNTPAAESDASAPTEAPAAATAPVANQRNWKGAAIISGVGVLGLVIGLLIGAFGFGGGDHDGGHKRFEPGMSQREQGGRGGQGRQMPQGRGGMQGQMPQMPQMPQGQMPDGQMMPQGPGGQTSPTTVPSTQAVPN